MASNHLRRGDENRRSLRVVMPSRWSLWSMPRHVTAYILGIDLAAISVTAVLLASHRPSGRDLVMTAVIIALGMVNTEISRHIERMRRRFADTPHVNLTSVWTVAAALVLSPGLAAAVVVLLYLHLWVRSWYRLSGVHAYRLTFSAATIILACHAVSLIGQDVGISAFLAPSVPVSLWAIPLGILAFSAVNSILVAVAIGSAERTTNLKRTLGSWQENAIEYATICLGVLTAGLLEWRPLFVAMFLPALHILHRSVLVRQLEQAVTIDPATGLLNATAWNALAKQELEKARRNGGTLGVLVIDIDHFQLIIDRCGQASGERVLREVAGALRTAVRRDDDCVGWLGNGFAAALPNVDLDQAIVIGERICDRVRKLAVPGVQRERSVVAGITVSVGVAIYPAAGTELDEVLLKADNAMFGAKDAGRDQVRAKMSTGIDHLRPNPR